MRGATLIEVLVTIAILSFGLLGVAALQVRMQQAQAESYHRAHAAAGHGGPRQRQPL